MLKIDIHKNVAFVLLNRPDIHNAFNDELVKQVTESFKELGCRNEVRLIVLAGNGKSFCAGADLNWTDSIAIPISHAATRPAPPPSAAPWTRAITGLGHFAIARYICPMAFASSRFSSYV